MKYKITLTFLLWQWFQFTYGLFYIAKQKNNNNLH